MLATIATLLLAAPVPPEAKVKPPEVRYTGTIERNGSVLLQFEVINPNATDLHYTGYTSDAFAGGLKTGAISPLYRLELKTGSDWKAQPLGWCKTGTGPVTIPAKGKGTFEAVRPDGTWDEARFGVTWFNSADRKKSEVAWIQVLRKGNVPK